MKSVEFLLPLLQLLSRSAKTSWIEIIVSRECDVRELVEVCEDLVD